MRIEQKAGQIEMVTYTDGYPHFVRVGIGNHLTINDLHDLRYAAERMIQKMQDAGCEP